MATASSSKKKANRVTGRLVFRRIPDANANAEKSRTAGQGTLFHLWRFHAFFTTTPAGVLDTVAADKTHRGRTVIEQVHADLKGSALAHMPSGVFTANSAWLVLAVIAFNLTRAAAVIAAATGAGSSLARANTSVEAATQPTADLDAGGSQYGADTDRADESQQAAPVVPEQRLGVQERSATPG